jgi:hypothetical protein
MAYDSQLTIPVVIANLVSAATGPQVGFDALFYTNAACTFGTQTGDLYEIVSINTGVNSDGVSLSAAAGAITLSLSSASVFPTAVVIPGYITASTFNGSTSAASVTIQFNDINFLSTSISLTGSALTAGIDGTKSSVIDNLIFASTNPSVAQLGVRGLRTAGGNARLVGLLG